jgi:hypothetical protein
MAGDRHGTKAETWRPSYPHDLLSGRQPAGGRHRATQSRPETGSPHGVSRFRSCHFRREGRCLFPAMDWWLMEEWANFSTECIIP